MLGGRAGWALFVDDEGGDVDGGGVGGVTEDGVSVSYAGGEVVIEVAGPGLPEVRLGV